MVERLYYPFTAIVGQEQMKEALLLNAIAPQIGGVLIRGKKGTAKSTASRALRNLMDCMKAVKGCLYLCDPEKPNAFCSECAAKMKRYGELNVEEKPVPFCDFPLSATEDMVLGGIDFEEALKSGQKKFYPGLLAKVNRGILYIDEVNLLNSHLVELILDVCTCGVNQIEREGISFIHPAKFILLGTMNPEEGEIGPQLLDRFGLSVEVENEFDPAKRLAIIKRREEFDKEPRNFVFQYNESENRLKKRIIESRKLLKEIFISESNLKLIVEIVNENNCAGHRAEIIMGRTARAIAALSNRVKIKTCDIKKAAEYALPHRIREKSVPPENEKLNNKQPQENDRQRNNNRPNSHKDEKNGNSNKPENKSDNNNTLSNASKPKNSRNNKDEIDKNSKAETPSMPQPELNFDIGDIFNSKTIRVNKDRIFRKGAGRRSRTKTQQKIGRYVKSVYKNKGSDIAIDATIRAASVFQKSRREAYPGSDLKIIIKEQDFRGRIREKKTGNFILFVVDASGSMGAYQRMVETKGAIMSLLLDAYQKRDKVGMIAFRRDKAECILPPTSSIELAGKLLKELTVGGKTPLAHAIALTHEILKVSFNKDKTIQPIIIIVTDGKANVPYCKDKACQEAMEFAGYLYEQMPVKYVVIDTEPRQIIRLGLAETLAAKLNAEYYRPEELHSDKILEITKGALR